VMRNAETILAVIADHIHEWTEGEPDDAKVSRPVRRGAEGKGRSRLPVPAVALQAHELRYKTDLASRLPYVRRVI
jgi:hypothetical protein